MLDYNELKAGTVFVLDGDPYEVLEYAFLRMQQRKPVAKTKIKNLISGKVIERTFHSNENFEEADIVRKEVKYLYNHRDQFWFADKNDASKRFALTEEIIGPTSKFFKPNSLVTAIKFEEKIIGVKPPIKVDLKVKDAPPGGKGDTASGGGKMITLETGATITAPLFVNIGDIIKVNTESGLYVERVEKSKE